MNSGKSEPFAHDRSLFEEVTNGGTFLQQIRMAEVEQASLKSEQLSDKSSSPALPDDLSLDEQTADQLLAREGKVGRRRVWWEGFRLLFNALTQYGVQ